MTQTSSSLARAGQSALAGDPARLRWLMPAAALLILAGLMLAGWGYGAGARDQARITAGSTLVLETEALVSDLKDIETGQRGFLLTGREEFLEPYLVGSRALDSRLAAIGQAAAAAEVTPGEELRRLAEAKRDWARRVIEIRRSGQAEAAIAAVVSGEGRSIMDRSRAAASTLQDAARARSATIADQRNQRLVRTAAASLGMLVLGSALLLVLAISRRKAERQANLLLAGVMENAPAGVAFLDRRLRLLQGNRALADMAEHILGVTPRRGAELLPEAARRQMDQKLTAVLDGSRGHANAEVELALPEQPNFMRHLLVSIFPLRHEGADRAVGGLGLFLLDTSARRRAEERLRRSETRSRLIIDSIPQLAWMTDESGAIQWYNRRWYDYTGTTEAEMMGWGWQSVHHPDHLAGVTARFRQAIEAGAPWEDTFMLRGADGTYRWFLSRAEPLLEADDAAPSGAAPRIVGWFGTNTDITEMRRVEEELEAARDAADDANRAKSQFIANMSHELRTPLSAVIGYAEMLEEEAADLDGAEVMQGDLRKIASNAQHLLSLINDVLDLSKIEAGRMEVQTEDFSASELVRDVAATVEGLVSKKGNRMLVDIEGDVGDDAFGFGQAAAVPVQPGRQCGEIHRGRQRDPGGLPRGGCGGPWLAVLPGRRYRHRDDRGADGAAVPPLRPGRQLHHAPLRRHRPRAGHHQGLRRHAGRRHHAGEHGRPRLDLHHPAAGGPADHPRRGPGRLRHRRGWHRRDRRGRPRARHRRRSGLARARLPLPPARGLRGALRAGGTLGIELARSLKPNAILLDVMMPQMDGWSVLASLKASPELAEIPVIMVTFVEERGLAFSLGAADYLTKPVQWHRLKGVLERYRATTTALILESDSTQRADLRRLLEGEGWSVEEAGTLAEIRRRMATEEAPPGLLLMEVKPGLSEGLGLINDLHADARWSKVPIIALAEGDIAAPELEKLRGQVRQVLPAEARPPAELVAELRRLAAPHRVPGVVPAPPGRLRADPPQAQEAGAPQAG